MTGMRRRLRFPSNGLTLAALVLAASAAWAGAAETWKSVPLVDTQCLDRVRKDPDAHTRQCALQCAKNGYGILTPDGTFLSLDEAGNKKAIEALKASKASDHLRVTVTGERQGDSIRVSALSLD